MGNDLDTKDMANDFVDIEDTNKKNRYILIVIILYFFVIILSVLLFLSLKNQKTNIELNNQIQANRSDRYNEKK